MALTGAYSGGVCYNTQAAALDAYYSQIPPSVTAGATNYQMMYVKSAGASGVWQTQVSTISGTGVATIKGTVNIVPPVFPSCDPNLGWQDGLTFALIVVGLIASASFYGLVARAR